MEDSKTIFGLTSGNAKKNFEKVVHRPSAGFRTENGIYGTDETNGTDIRRKVEKSDRNYALAGRTGFAIAVLLAQIEPHATIG